MNSTWNKCSQFGNSSTKIEIVANRKKKYDYFIDTKKKNDRHVRILIKLYPLYPCCSLHFDFDQFAKQKWHCKIDLSSMAFISGFVCVINFIFDLKTHEPKEDVISHEHNQSDLFNCNNFHDKICVMRIRF